jgi:hypothetical protein
MSPEHPCRLDDDIDTEVSPRQLGWIALREDLEPVAVDHHVAVDDLDGPRVSPVHRVVSEQVGIRVDVAEIVDRNDVDTSQRPENVVPGLLDGIAIGDVDAHQGCAQLGGDVGPLCRAEEVPSDPAESVDGYFHAISPPRVSV